MLKRSITGAILIAFIVGVFVLKVQVSSLFFDGLIMLMSVLGTLEMFRAFGGLNNFTKKKENPETETQEGQEIAEKKVKISISQMVVILLYVLSIFPTFYFVSEIFPLFSLVVAGLLLFILTVFDHKHCDLENLGYSFISLFYPSVFLLTMHFINNMGAGSYQALILVFTVTPVADTMAYLVGRSVKGPKLCPNISPKKTISGFIGGLVGGGLGAMITYFIFGDSIFAFEIPNVLTYIILGIVCSAFSVVGDLTESVIKRNLGLKDMGRILPGHGGILDRIDSIIFASCFFFVILLF